MLDDWCRAVGPAVVLEPSLSRATPRLDEIALISWNVDVGGGDLDALLEWLRDDRQMDRPIVLLLQEAYRAGELIPPVAGPHHVPHRIEHAPPSGQRRSVIDVARARHLSLAYVPSMRNGSEGIPEDRGNAILSNLRLHDLEAIELPFEHQRRVAIAATVSVLDADGRIVPLRVVSAHLDARATWKHGLFFWSGRRRQADALVGQIDRERGATIVGGDFNSWLGGLEPEVRHLRRDFPQTPSAHTRVTFPVLGAAGFHLDHLFFRLRGGWHAEVVRVGERRGSDHYPLLATFRSG